MENQTFESVFESIAGIPPERAERDPDGRVFIPETQLVGAATETRRALNDLAQRDWRNDYNPEHRGAWLRPPH